MLYNREWLCWRCGGGGPLLTVGAFALACNKHNTWNLEIMQIYTRIVHERSSAVRASDRYNVRACVVRASINIITTFWARTKRHTHLDTRRRALCRAGALSRVRMRVR